MQFFQGNFAVTLVIKNYTEMYESCVHPDYDYFYIH